MNNFSLYFNNTLEKGTEVLLFRGYDYGTDNCIFETLFIKGVIIKVNKNEYAEKNGKTYCHVDYDVLGEDNILYHNVERSYASFPKNFLRTIPEHLNHIDNVIDKNLEKIDVIHNDNKVLMDTYKKLYKYQEEKGPVKSLSQNK